MLSPRKLADIDSLGTAGLVKGFTTEYIEARVFSGSVSDADKSKVATAIGAAASAKVDPVVLEMSGSDDTVSVVIPRASKLDLAAFVPARDHYDTLEWDDKLLIHSWLLDLGVMLCEPSIRFDGMGGECIWGCACWVVVPHAAIRGETAVPAAEEVTEVIAGSPEPVAPFVTS
jgi:hypothetical protein